MPDGAWLIRHVILFDLQTVGPVSIAPPGRTSR
ncbi:UNVERIFIED_ORG: hypothetical protein J2806_000958 [Kosakonia oryzae]|nr:hypothetical protein [Kosakonia oryzae]